MAENTHQILLWEINSSMDLTTAHKTQFDLEIEDGTSDVNGAFDTEGSLFIASVDGVWHVKIGLGFKYLHKLT